MIYRNYEIMEWPNNYPFPFQYVHCDYNGPEDNRIGNGDSVQDCRNAIDDAISDLIHCEQCDSSGTISWSEPVYPNNLYSEEVRYSDDCDKCSEIRKRLKIEICSHCRDNQGFCHNCGVPLCEESLRATEYWTEGMQVHSYVG